MRLISLLVAISILGLTACAGNTAPETSSRDAYKERNVLTPVQNEPLVKTNKRSKDNCHPEVETQKYLNLVAKTVDVELLWIETPESLKGLRLPFQVVTVTDEGLVVLPHDFMLREHYMSVLFGTGHLFSRDDTIVLDVCSAELTESTYNPAL